MKDHVCHSDIMEWKGYLGDVIVIMSMNDMWVAILTHLHDMHTHHAHMCEANPNE